MKNKRTPLFILVVCMLLALLVVPAAAVGEPDDTGKRTFTFALLSDVHYVDPASVPAEGTAAREHFDHAESAEVRLMSEIDTVLSKALDGAIASKPDAVLVSGDLTSNGEYANASAFSSRLRDAKERLSNGAGVYVVNGNHDLNMSYAASFADDGIHEAQRMQQEDFRTLFADLGYGGAEGFSYYADVSDDATATAEVRNSGGLSYATRIADGVTLIALDVAMYGNNAEARFNQAQRTAGYVSEGLLSWAKEQAEAAKARGDLVLAMAHHAMLPHTPMDSETVASYMKEVIVGNWEEVANTLADAGVSAFITGHAHTNDIATHVSPAGNTVYDINSAALCAYPCAWRTLKVTVNGSGTTATYDFAIDTTFIEAADGIDDLQAHSYEKTGLSERNMEPMIDYLLRLELHDITSFEDATYGTGLTGYLRQKLSVEGSVGAYATTLIQDTMADLDVSTDVSVMSLYNGQLTAKFNRLEGSTAFIDASFVNASTGIEETATIAVNLETLPTAIDGLIARVDQLLAEADWSGNYTASSLQQDLNKLLLQALTQAGTTPLDENDPLSSALGIANEAYMAHARGDEQTFVWKELGISSAEELTQRREAWHALLVGDAFAQKVSEAAFNSLKSLTSDYAYPVLADLAHTTRLVSEGAQLVSVLDASQDASFLPLVGTFAGAIRSVGDLVNFLGIASINPVSPTMVQPLGQIVASMQEAFITDNSIADDSVWHFHSVYFDATGGAVSPAWDLTVEDGRLGRSTLEGAELPEPVREGYRFIGWFTQAEGGDPVDVNADYTDIDRIYAQWTFTGSYSCTEGDRGSWTKGTDQALSFVFKRSMEDETTRDHFAGIRVDGQDVDAAHYTVETGSVVVRLSPSYVGTLADGTHTLTAVFDDAEDVNVSFTVQAAKKVLFVDVTDATAHYEDIYWLAEAGVSKGWEMADGTVQFRPYANVARADMAAFLFRLAANWGVVDTDWQPDGTTSFADVSASTAHNREIAWLAASGISKGWEMADGTVQFRPYANVARADMAAFIARLAALVKIDSPSDTSDTPTFADVTDKTAHADDIAWLAASGISKGWEMADGTVQFRPYANVARADMAAFLHRLNDLKG